MRIAIVWAIVWKELIEALRDRRTLTRMVLLPIAVYPLFAIGISKFQGAEKEAREARPSRVAVWGDPPASVLDELGSRDKFVFSGWTGAPDELRQGWSALQLPEGVDPDAKANDDEGPKPQRMIPAWWVEPPNPALEAARAALSRKDIDAVVAFWPGFGPTLDGGGKARVAVYFDQVRQDSFLARERLERALRLERKRLQGEREKARELPAGHSWPYEILTRVAVIEERSGGQVLGSMMPMVLILMSLLGGFLPAIDLTAGEKERGTMQTLLCAPVRPIEIISGKFLAVFVISLLTALLNVVSLGLTMKRILPPDMAASASTYGLTALLLIPVTFLFSALFLAMAAFARDFKDGQNVLMPAYLPLTLLSGVAGMPGVELNRATAFAPVLNVALLIKSLFMGETQAELVFWVLVSSGLYAALALLLAARVFSLETVLLGGNTTLRDLLGVGEGKGQAPGPSFAVLAFTLSLVCAFYGSMFLEKSGILVVFTATQLGFFFGAPLLGVLFYGYSLQKTYAIEAPRPRVVAGAVLLAASAWSVVAGLVTWLLPPPPELTKALEKALSFDGAPYWAVLLLGAGLPALCEETLFRGVIFGGLRPLGTWPALLISSLLFALAHGSVYRLLPTFALGLVMGLLRHRSGSLLPSMVFHGLHNGLAVTLLYTKPAWAGSLLGSSVLPAWVIGAGSALFALALWVALGGKVGARA